MTKSKGVRFTWQSLNEFEYAERFWSGIDIKIGSCWLSRRQPNGYGYVQIPLKGRQIPAHRIAYELVCGPIPDGFEVDHTCHNSDLSCKGGDGCVHRRCCNPLHLEAVHPDENKRRAGAHYRQVTTTCKNGHNLAEVGVRWTARKSPLCEACRRERLDREMAQRRKIHSDTHGRPACGTAAAVRLTTDDALITCTRCQQSRPVPRSA